MLPDMAAPCIAQRYGYEPAVLNVLLYVPVSCVGELVPSSKFTP